MTDLCDSFLSAPLPTSDAISPSLDVHRRDDSPTDGTMTEKKEVERDGPPQPAQELDPKHTLYRQWEAAVQKYVITGDRKDKAYGWPEGEVQKLTLHLADVTGKRMGDPYVVSALRMERICDVLRRIEPDIQLNNRRVRLCYVERDRSDVEVSPQLLVAHVPVGVLHLEVN